MLVTDLVGRRIRHPTHGDGTIHAIVTQEGRAVGVSEKWVVAVISWDGKDPTALSLDEVYVANLKLLPGTVP